MAQFGFGCSCRLGLLCDESIVGGGYALNQHGIWTTLLVKGSTVEVMITGKSRGRFHGNPDPFAMGGDEGAWVVDARGDVAGMAYGYLCVYSAAEGTGATFVGAGLVTSMDEVLVFVKAKTGGEVGLPCFPSDVCGEGSWLALWEGGECGRGFGVS